MKEMESLDTIALLQDEVARLEEELRLRDEVLAAAPPESAHGKPDGQLCATDQRVKDLSADLAQRDETIDLLWDQVRGLEESREVMLAEWREVEQWVEQLEQRAAAGADPAQAAADPANEPSPGPRERTLDDPAEKPIDQAPEQPCRASESEQELVHRLQLAETELHAQQAEFAAFRERTNREIDEYHREIEGLKRQLEKIQRTENAQPLELSPDERIRALRRHLMDVHIQESEERRSRTLLARLSRLFQHTAL